MTVVGWRTKNTIVSMGKMSKLRYAIRLSRATLRSKAANAGAAKNDRRNRVNFVTNAIGSLPRSARA